MKMAPNSAAVTSPGRTIGSITCQSTLKWLQPSTSAASSISRGTSSKKPIMIQTMSGSEKAT